MRATPWLQGCYVILHEIFLTFLSISEVFLTNGTIFSHRFFLSFFYLTVCIIQLCDFGLARSLGKAPTAGVSPGGGGGSSGDAGGDGDVAPDVEDGDSGGEVKLTEYVVTRWWRAPEVREERSSIHACAARAVRVSYASHGVIGCTRNHTGLIHGVHFWVFYKNSHRVWQVCDFILKWVCGIFCHFFFLTETDCRLFRD